MSLIVGCALGGWTGCQRPTAASKPSQAAAEALPSDAELIAMLDEAINYTEHHRRLATDKNAAWQIMHGVVAFGPDLMILHDGKLVPAIDHAMNGGPMKGWNLRKGDVGIVAEMEEGSKTGQGHPNQWIGYMSHHGVPSTKPLIVGGKEYTLADLIAQAMWDTYEGQEASWTLMCLADYLPDGETWKTKDGEEWDMERMAAMEAKQDIPSSACGGGHRLSALAMALNKHRQHHPDEPLTPGWQAAQDKIEWGIKTARHYQHASGAFSTTMFAGPSFAPDLSGQMSSSGHVLEFLTFALSDEQLKEPWVVRNVVFLTELFRKTREFDLDCGGLYHSTNALIRYRERRFGPRPKVESTLESPSEAAPEQPSPVTAAK